MIAQFLWATWANRSWLLIFVERPERFAHIAHFWWAIWAIHSHRSPKKRKWAFAKFFNKFFLKSYINIKHTKNKILDFFCQIFLSESLIRSFPLSNLSKSLMVAHLSWATWAIRSRSLISSEWPEQFAHGNSCVLSDLSESLTVAHLIWAKWSNEQMSDERMSKFPALGFGQHICLLTSDDKGFSQHGC